jgi:hypothetical protein
MHVDTVAYTRAHGVPQAHRGEFRVAALDKYLERRGPHALLEHRRRGRDICVPISGLVHL